MNERRILLSGSLASDLLGYKHGSEAQIGDTIDAIIIGSGTTVSGTPTPSSKTVYSSDYKYHWTVNYPTSFNYSLGLTYGKYVSSSDTGNGNMQGQWYFYTQPSIQNSVGSSGVRTNQSFPTGANCYTAINFISNGFYITLTSKPSDDVDWWYLPHE